MTNEIVQPESKLVAIGADQIIARKKAIDNVFKKVMKKDVHYGPVFDGNGEKNALLKAGAEVLLATFQISLDPIVEDLSIPGESFRYRVTVKAYSGDKFLGAGIGEASSAEDKYNWRASLSDDEFEATPDDKRRVLYKKGREKIYTVKQVRTNPANIANTVLKMAKKRGMVDTALTVLGASDMFTQDLDDEDTARELGANGTPATPAPKEKPTGSALPKTPFKLADIKAKIGQTVESISGFLGKVVERQTKTKKDVTDYYVYEGTETAPGECLCISIWGKAKPVAPGMATFINVEISEFNGETRGTAKAVANEI